MVEIPDNVMRIARDVARLARFWLAPDARVILFGSWARGDAFPRSDLDVAISVGKRVPYQDLLQLTMLVDAVRGLRHVDVVDLEAADAAFRAEILDNGIEL